MLFVPIITLCKAHTFGYHSVYGGHFGPGPVRLPTTTSTQGYVLSGSVIVIAINFMVSFRVYGGHFGPGPVKLPSTTTHSTYVTFDYEMKMI